MCFHLSYALQPDKLEARFSAKLVGEYQPHFYVNAFSNPRVPVITDKDPESIQLFEWGLIPSWCKDDKVEKIRNATANARSDTVFEKPSFREPIRSKRCMVLADGFYEWREFQGRNYPYYIQLKNGGPFAFAGIWDAWKDKRTFSIITTKANPMMEVIHNKKKRMPVILPRKAERKWLNIGKGRDRIAAFLLPYDENDMKAHTVSRLVSMPKSVKDVPQAVEPFDYPELKLKQDTLF